MPSSTVIDILIGLFFTYMLLSVMCSALNEWIGALTMSRPRNLALGVKALLNDPKGAFVFNVAEKDAAGNVVLKQKNLYNELVDHPLIQGLTRPGLLSSLSSRFKWPQYIPSEHFATALLDVLAPSESAAQPRSLGDVLTAIDALPEGDTKRVLRVLAQSSGPRLENLKGNLGAWFDGGMERVSGWYKQRTQVMVLILGGLIAVALNADTFMMLRVLASDPAQRAVLVAAAQSAVKGAEPGTAGGNAKPEDVAAAKKRLDAATAAIRAQSLPILWTANAPAGDPRRIPRTMDEWWLKIAGFAVSAIAISMGAPFYFDLLKKLVNTRLTGTPPDEARPRRPVTTPPTHV